MRPAYAIFSLLFFVVCSIESTAQKITQTTNTIENTHIFRHHAELIPSVHLGGYDTSDWNADFRLLEGAAPLYGKDLGKYYFPKILRLIVNLDSFVTAHFNEIKSQPALMHTLAEKLCTVDENLVFISPDIGDQNYFSLNEELNFSSFDAKDREEWIKSHFNNGPEAATFDLSALSDHKLMALEKLLFWWVENYHWWNAKDKSALSSLPDLSITGNFEVCLCNPDNFEIPLTYKMPGNKIVAVKYQNLKQEFNDSMIYITGIPPANPGKQLLHYFTLFYSSDPETKEKDSLVVTFNLATPRIAAIYETVIPDHLASNAKYILKFGTNKTSCRNGRLECSEGELIKTSKNEYIYTAPISKTNKSIIFSYVENLPSGETMFIDQITIPLELYKPKALEIYTTNILQFNFNLPSADCR